PSAFTSRRTASKSTFGGCGTGAPASTATPARSTPEPGMPYRSARSATCPASSSSSRTVRRCPRAWRRAPRRSPPLSGDRGVGAAPCPAELRSCGSLVLVLRPADDSADASSCWPGSGLRPSPGPLPVVPRWSVVMGDLLRVVLGSSASLLPRGSRLTRSLPTPGPDSLGLAPDTTPGLGQQLGGRRVVLGTVGALLDQHKKGVLELAALPLLLLSLLDLERGDLGLGGGDLLSESGHDCSFR